MTFNMNRSRLRKMSSITGFTSQAMRPSAPDTKKARRVPAARVRQWGRRYGSSRSSQE